MQSEYKVVMNAEGQYSLWPYQRANPVGWDEAGKTGSRDDCLDYIADVWTDLRPRSVRAATDG